MIQQMLAICHSENLIVDIYFSFSLCVYFFLFLIFLIYFLFLLKCDHIVYGLLYPIFPSNDFHLFLKVSLS